MTLQDFHEWCDVAEALKLGDKLDYLEANLLAQPVDEKNRRKRQAAIDRISVQYETKLMYNRYTEAKELKSARERGNAFLAEAKRLYEQSLETKH